MNLTTDAELAEQMSLSVDELHTLRRRHQWPCVKLGRFAYRFTDEQVAQIVERHTVAPKRTADQPAVIVAGQTARSAARRSA